MKAKIHHMAILVNEFDTYVKLFQDIFGMEIERIQGEKPGRKLWFREGIQLNESPERITLGNRYDHIGLLTDNTDEILKKAMANGCKPLPQGRHWFARPNGVQIELKEK